LNLDIETDHDGDSKSYALRKTSWNRSKHS
jgi:hypothetical protein